jgi:hypothetical protein
MNWMVILAGALRHSTDSYKWPIAVLACVTALTAVMVWHFPMERLPTDARPQPQNAAMRLTTHRLWRRCF